MKDENKKTDILDDESDGESSETEVIDIIDESEVTDETTEELTALQEENAQLQDKLLRVQAEFENYRKRTEKEKIAERKYKAQEIALDLLTTLDNFERALKTEVTEESKGFKEGMEMIYNQLTEALKSHGVEEMHADNAEFDPNLHHAVMQVEEEGFESNVVIEVLQKGFMLKDRVLRPAMVKVNK